MGPVILVMKGGGDKRGAVIVSAKNFGKSVCSIVSCRHISGGSTPRPPESATGSTLFLPDTGTPGASRIQ